MSGARPGSGPPPEPHPVCSYCMRAIVPEVTAVGVVIQCVTVTHKNKLSNFHPNCSSTKYCLPLQQLAAYDAVIAAFGAAYEKTCSLD